MEREGERRPGGKKEERKLMAIKERMGDSRREKEGWGEKADGETKK